MPERLLQRGRLDEIVLVELVDEPGGGRGKADVARGASSAVLLVADDAHAWILAQELLEHRARRFVRRGVVDYDPFPLLERLAHHGADRLLKDAIGFVEGRDDRDDGGRTRVLGREVEAGPARGGRRVGEVRVAGVDQGTAPAPGPAFSAVA
jgi:hypothetical protein